MRERARRNAIAPPVGPKRQRASDDRARRKRAEIAAVETVLDLSVHDEDFVGCDDAAALPVRQGASLAVALERGTHRNPVHRDDTADAADFFSGKRLDVLQHRHAEWKVTTRGREPGDRLWRVDDSERASPWNGHFLDRIEPDRCAGGRVPQQQRRHLNQSRRDGRDDGRKRRGHASAAAHVVARLRNRKARCCSSE